MINFIKLFYKKEDEALRDMVTVLCIACFEKEYPAYWIQDIGKIEFRNYVREKYKEKPEVFAEFDSRFPKVLELLDEGITRNI
jgi:hypothetical protein